MQEIIKYQEIDMNIKKLDAELKSSANRKNAAEMQQYLKDSQSKLVSLDENAKALSDQYEKAVAIYNLYPLYQEELDTIMQAGWNEFVNKIPDDDLRDYRIINPKRKNYCQ